MFVHNRLPALFEKKKVVSFMKIISHFVFVVIVQNCYSQQYYVAEMQAYQKNYIDTHEVVKGKDKKYFHFFAVDSNYRVNAVFEKITDTVGFSMKTSGNTLQQYFKYGKVSFNINGTPLHLLVYQSKELMKSKHYADYLFIPFLDKTTGDITYGSGRYLDFTIAEITNNKLTVDFNKAYNPYCAYAPGYHCPVPPRENFLPIAINAGEMNFGKANH
jgi:uncharacterized protein (DUF1684 family)